MTHERTKLDLSTIGDGVVHELFERELGKVLEDIADPNTPPEDKRSIVLTIEFKPDDQREQLGVFVQAQAKLAKGRGHAAMAHMGKTKKGRIVAIPWNPRQESLDFADEREGDEDVIPINEKETVT